MPITEDVKSIRIQLDTAEEFLRELENAYLFSPGKFETYEFSEEHPSPINKLVVRNQIILLIILEGINIIIPESSFYSFCVTTIQHQFAKLTTSHTCSLSNRS